LNTLPDYVSFLEELSSIKFSEKIRLGLERIEELLHRCGDPHERLKSIVVAGTNGKGSVTAMLSNILKTEGYKVGTYISPHLCNIRERIMINGQWIEEEAFLEVGKMILEEAKQMYDSPSFYEILTAMAFLYFSKRNIDIAVLEIGLGGRLDAVNVVHPIQSIITTIDLDHENYLGNTIQSIAREKAGIIKEGTVVILGEEKEEAVKVIEDISLENRAPLYRKGRDFDFNVKKFSLEESIMDFRDNKTYLQDVKLGLKGEYQFLNTSVALEASLLLNDLGIKLSEKSIRDGIKSARWRGRFETFELEDKVVILDCAHNPHGIRALVSSLEKLFKGKKICFVFGVMRDKNYIEMLRELSKIASRLILTTIKENDRALPVDVLLEATKEIMKGENIPIRGIESPLTALREGISSSEDVVCFCGSLYLIGKILEENGEIGGLKSFLKK